jgi:hypothetical protein
VTPLDRPENVTASEPAKRIAPRRLIILSYSR